ncbi:MAG: GspE/PulE family protein [Burkholderiaceae bacterium]|jgi:general secretion pathway protein E
MSAVVTPPPSAQVPSDQRVGIPLVVKWLTDEGMVIEDQIRAIYAAAGHAPSGQHPLITIGELKLKSQRAPHRTLLLDALSELMASKADLPFVRIDPLKIDFARIGDLMSSTYANRFRILPLEIRPNEVTIATAEPFLMEWVPEMERILRAKIKRVVANPHDITRFIAEFFSLARSVKGAVAKGGAAAQNSFEQLVELGNVRAAGRQYDSNDAHIVQIVDWLWQFAFDQRASDIHLEPRRDQGVVRFRIDGLLHQVYQVPIGVLSAMVSRIKLLGRMDVVEKRRPQDGRIKTRTFDATEVELRLSTLPTAFGEKLVMRIFDPDVVVKDFAELGFSDEDSRRWNSLASRPNGIILVTGPTGSGKTTTLYSTLKTLATEEVNVCTIEDPIEMVEGAFNQMQVQAGIDLGFADGVRALMRQDPDIIMVGEIRDSETADMAVQAALTGHLVFSTVHTNDAPSAVTRLLELGVPAYLLNATVLGILAQRLVRILCPHCKVSGGTVDPAIWSELISPWKTATPVQVYNPVGCLECRMTGYRGRTGIYELLEMSLELKKLVSSEPSIDPIRNQAIREGMHSLRLSGAMKVAAGVTTVEEVLRSAPRFEQI